MLRINKLLMLLVVTVLVVTVAVVMTFRSSPAIKKEKELVFSGLVDRINDIAEIRITSKDGELTVKLIEGQWVIEQADNYPASFSKVKQVAIAVTDLKILDLKTNNPSLYEKLGVEDPESENAKSKRLILLDSDNGELASLIVGTRRTSSAPGSTPGYYVRISDQAQALLVEGDLNISTKPSDWFEAQIIDIDSKHVRDVVINHPDGSSVQLSRESGTDDFLLSNVPGGKETQSTYTLNRVGSILANVRVDDVRSADNFEFPETPTVATVGTFDGMTATINSTVKDEENWAWFEFEYQAPAPDEVEASPDVAEGTPDEQQPAPEKSSEEEAAIEGAEVEKSDTQPQEQKEQIDQEQVEQLQQKTTGWVYKIPSYKFELFTRKLDDLVKDIEQEEEEQEQGQQEE